MTGINTVRNIHSMRLPECTCCPEVTTRKQSTPRNTLKLPYSGYFWTSKDGKDMSKYLDFSKGLYQLYRLAISVKLLMLLHCAHGYNPPLVWNGFGNNVYAKDVSRTPIILRYIYGHRNEVTNVPAAPWDITVPKVCLR